MPAGRTERPEKTSIRLLAPRRSRDGDDLRFTLQQFDVDDAPPYVAVSYMWGNGAATKTIYVGDAKIRVRENLYWCLYYARQNSNWKLLWVDRLCINQDNVMERNAQVHAMDAIYSNADVVVAWLDIEPGQQWRHHVAATCLEHDSEDLREYASQLARRPYWSRRWVVQEILLAVDVKILCGSYCISWNLFREWILSDVEHTAEHTAAPTALGALPFLLGKDPQRPYFPHVSLESLLLDYRHTDCQDPRDRVFSLLGLLGKEERAALTQDFPDYSLTHNEVVYKTMEHLGGVQTRKSRGGDAVTDHSIAVLASLGSKV